MPKPSGLSPTAVARLLSWFDTHHRRLPFRETRDPYRIWVSEVMLQQTTIAAVVPYFTRFIERFPTVSSLAKAEESEVLALWEGLGYYRRARHLHAAARRLLADFGDRLPDDPSYWAELPGVGRYILGAVLSQAFDRRLPIVEANTLRLLTRLFGYPEDPRKSAGQIWLWERAEAILPTTRVGDFNQALMELGATVCKIEAPHCSACPLKRQCRARREGTTDRIPLRPVTRPLSTLRTIVLMAMRRHRVLLAKRPGHVRWAGMWEFPHGDRSDHETVDAASIRIAHELLSTNATIIERWPESVQTVTRYRMTVTPVRVELKGAVKSGFYEELRWMHPEEAASLPMPVLQRALLNQCG